VLAKDDKIGVRTLADRALMSETTAARCLDVCAHADGSPINPLSLSAWCRTNSPIGYHGLRHRHARLLLGSGASIEAVSGRLGHASAAMTLSNEL
jgi:integrase